MPQLENITGNYKLQAEVFYSDTTEKETKDFVVNSQRVNQQQQINYLT